MSTVDEGSSATLPTWSPSHSSRPLVWRMREQLSENSIGLVVPEVAAAVEHLQALNLRAGHAGKQTDQHDHHHDDAMTYERVFRCVGRDQKLRRAMARYSGGTRERRSVHVVTPLPSVHA